jgi:hypothetical protein
VAELRRNRRLIEHIDPVTGARTYTDELTGEIVAQDQVAQYTVVQQPVVPPVVQTTETVVTERLTPGQTYVTREQVTQPVTPVAPVVEPATVVRETPVVVARPLASRISQIIYLIFSVLEALLAIRFVLQLLGANPASGFASLIYGLTGPFLLPFNGLFGQPAAGGSVIEVNTIVAMIVYPLLAWLLVRLTWLVVKE